MPNRTYVEMYVETGRYNYILKDRLYYINLLRKAYQYLCDHPEKVEEVVKERVRVGKFAKPYAAFQWLFLELRIINSWIVDETFSGDTVYTVPVSLTPLNSYGLIPEIRVNNTDPIYIPKHIQHRKKRRK